MRPIKIKIEYGKYSATWIKKSKIETKIEKSCSNKTQNSYHDYVNENFVDKEFMIPRISKHIYSIIPEEHIYDIVADDSNIFRKCFNFLFNNSN